MWDWRVMSPWLKRIEDELAEFPLSPPPGSELHLRGLGNISVPSRLDGQWDMPPGCSGSAVQLELCHRTRQFDARELLLLNSGPWLFDQCQLRASGCQAVRCERQAVVRICCSFIGGYGIDAAQTLVFEDAERASNGIVVTDSAEIALEVCRIESTGFLHGSALKFRGRSSGHVRRCALSMNYVGVDLEGQARVGMEESVMYAHNASLFHVHDTQPNQVTLTLANCTGEADVVFYDDVEPQTLQEEGCSFAPPPPQSFDDYFFDTFINVPAMPALLPEGQLPYYLAMQRAGYTVDKGANIVICEACGATNDLNDDSSTCWECLDSPATFRPKYSPHPHTCMHTCTLPRAPPPTHTQSILVSTVSFRPKNNTHTPCTRTRTCTHAHARTHARTHARARAHTHTHRTPYVLAGTWGPPSACLAAVKLQARLSWGERKRERERGPMARLTLAWTVSGGERG